MSDIGNIETGFKNFSINMPKGMAPLRIGQQVSGSVLGFTEGKPIVLLGGKPVIAESKVPLKIGEKLALLVDGIQDGRVQLKVLNSKTSPFKVKPDGDALLKELGFAPTENGKKALNSLILMGQGLEKEKLESLIGILNKYPNLKIEDPIISKLSIDLASRGKSEIINFLLENLSSGHSLAELINYISSDPGIKKWLKNLLPVDSWQDPPAELKKAIISTGFDWESFFSEEEKKVQDDELSLPLKFLASSSNTEAGKRIFAQLSAMQLSSMDDEAFAPIPLLIDQQLIFGNMSFSKKTKDSKTWKSPDVPSTAAIELDLPSLGKIKATIALLKGQSTIKIEADNPKAQELIREKMPNLRKKLGAKGISIAGLLIALADRKKAIVKKSTGSIDVRI